MRSSRAGRLGVLVAATVSIGALGTSSAGAAAGVIDEYPIPILTTPYGITTGPDGKLWFVDSGNHEGGTFVGRMSTSGASSPSEVVQLPSPKLGLAAALGPDGNMWVAQDGQIDRVPVNATATGQIEPFALGHGTGGYGSIVAGPDGRLWFGWNTQIGAITTGGAVKEYETNSGTSVEGVIVGPDGKLWYGEGNKIARMDTAGNTTAGEDFALPPGDGGINALALGPDGNVWFTLGVPAAIGRITPGGAVTVFPTPTAASLPFGLAAGPDGQIWFAERNGDKIGSIPTTATSGADITEYPIGHENTGLLYITAGADNRMWFTEFNRNMLGAITTNAAPPASGPGSGSGPTLTTSLAPVSPIGASAPTISGARQSNSLWRAGNGLAKLTKKRKIPIGTTFSFVLNEPSSVILTFTQRVGGRKVRGSCKAQSKGNRRKPACKRTVTAGTIVLSGHAGLNKIAFQGRIAASKKLRPGPYALGIVARAAGESSSPAKLRFTIVKG
jgi:streptogramin lyase